MLVTLRRHTVKKKEYILIRKFKNEIINNKGIPHYSLVSAQVSDKKSIFLYARTKAEVTLAKE